MNSNPRIVYLHNMGLSHDPFATPVAEQEISRLRGGFYAYFVFPTLPGSQHISLQELRAAQHTLVFGEPGSGKTTLRLTLEADCRTVLDDTLVVSYIMGDDIDAALSFEEHGVRLAKAFAIDFFVQVVEQFNPLNPAPTEEQIYGLQNQIQQGGAHIKRLIRRMLDDPFRDRILGLSAHWVGIGKAPVRYVSPSKKLLELLSTCLESPPHPLRNGWEAVSDGLKISRSWGFKHTLTLIDGVDTRLRSTDEMLRLIEPLLKWMTKAETHGVYLKFFLPLEIKEIIIAFLRKEGLSSKAFLSIILDWEQESLQKLLKQRFRAANTRYMGLNSLVESSTDLDQIVMSKARGSPRRLLQAIGEIIDVHMKPNQDSI